MNAAKLCGSRPLGYGHSLLDQWYPGLSNQVFTIMLMLETARRLKVGNDRGVIIFGQLVSSRRDTPALCSRGFDCDPRDVPLEAYPSGLKEDP